MHKKSKVYLDDIISSISKIEKYVAGFSFEKFKDNGLVADAVMRNLEIIGEAAKKVDEELKKKYKDVEWKKVAGLRDILIHAYSEVDLEVVWDVLKNKLSSLKSSVQKIVSELT